MPDFLQALLDRGHFLPTDAAGCYGLGQEFEAVVTAFGRYIDALADGVDREHVRFPPLVPRSCLEATGFMASMPHMAGLVGAFEGDETAHRELVAEIHGGGDWSKGVIGTELALAPSGCYPLYPTCRGELPEAGRLFDLGPAYAFRREPSDDPARLQIFRMRELVRIGRDEQVLAWRDAWLERGAQGLARLGLGVGQAVASDPFYGRGGVIMADAQRAQRLKFELRAPIGGDDRERALASFNYHVDHFGRTFEIRMPGGSFAHSACFGFGLERVALALLWRHGLDTRGWPAEVRRELWP